MLKIGNNIVFLKNIKIEQNSRTRNYNLSQILKSTAFTSHDQAYEIKTIDDINNFNIFGSTNDYSHIMLIENNGTTDLKWFRLDFISKDKFKLTTSTIDATEPIIDNKESIVDFGIKNQKIKK